MFFFAKSSEHYNIRNMMALCLLLTIAGSAHAAEVSTLRESVAVALEHNRQLAADGTRVEAAEAGREKVQGYLLPRLDLSTGVVRTDTPGSYFGMRLNQRKITAADFVPSKLNNPGFINNYQSNINLSMPIYEGGKLWAGQRAAAGQLASAQQNHAYMRQRVIFQTIQGYVQLRQADAAIAAIQTAVRAANKRYQDAQQLHQRGVLIKSDVMDARVHLLQAKLQLKQAENNRLQAVEQLQRILGLEPDSELKAEAAPQLRTFKGSLSEAVAVALKNRADLQAMEAAYQASEAQVDQARAAFLPHVDLVAGQQWNAATPALKNRSSMIGATVNLNLFAGGSDKAEMRAARAKMVALELKIADTKQQIHNEVARAWRARDELKLRLASDAEALKQSEESLRIKSVRYQQGLAQTTDLLDAQSQVDRLRLMLIQARSDLVIGEASLLLAAGQLSEGVIQ